MKLVWYENLQRAGKFILVTDSYVVQKKVRNHIAFYFSITNLTNILLYQ